MKRKRFKSNYIIFILVILLGIFSFVSYKTSYGFSSEMVEEPVKDSVELSDKEVWAFLENLEDVNEIGFVKDDEEDVVIEEIVVAPKEDKEDPIQEIKKNNVEKGKPKETTAKKAVQKYETNETSLGIDVSTWQGDIDWKKVKKSGINFAMIRCGFRRLDSGAIVMDNTFEDNIKGAIANNINVGVYFFSMAKNSEEALEEAKWVVNVIKNYDITYPVAIDTEIFNKYRLKGVDYSTLTNNALVFCNYVKKKGYTPMIYSYANAFNKYFDTAKFSGQRIWLAHYAEKTSYKGTHHMWQYTSSGSVPGIKGRVDMNVAYFSVTNDVTKKSTVNGITNTGDLEIVEFKDMRMKTKLTKDVVIRSSPYTTLPNKAGSLAKGTDIIVTGMGQQFIRFEYRGDTFYVNDTGCFEMILDEVVFNEVDVDVKVINEVELLKQPYTFLNNNSSGKLLVDQEVKVIGINVDFVKVKIDENIYYVNDLEFYEVIKDNGYGRPSGSGTEKEYS